MLMIFQASSPISKAITAPSQYELSFQLEIIS